MSTPNSFFLPDGPDRFLSTQWTRGPWSAHAQHGGPPSALLARALARCPSPAPMRIARLAFDLLRPVPIAPLTIRTEIVRPGRRVDLVEAVLADERDGQVMRAAAWRVRSAPVDGVTPTAAERPAISPAASQPADFFVPGEDVAYHHAVEWRFASGSWLEPGPASVWGRMKVPLLPDEPITPLDRVLVVADSASGVSRTLDPLRHLFINPDLVVHLHREPAGEWVLMTATTRLADDGIALTEGELADEEGPIGRVAQSLLIDAQG